MTAESNRRRFVKLCGSAALAVAANPRLLANDSAAPHRYQRVALVDRHHRPLRAQALPAGASLVFNYPYATTPCFLLNLGRPVDGDSELQEADGATYRWPGGTGANRSVVSFAAICTHKLSHPARPVSFIDYRSRPVRFIDADHHTAERGGVIKCCSEGSVYDPARGAVVLGGPAPQPLTTILLDYDARDDTLHAVGTLGAEVYDRFFARFAFRLELENRTDHVRQLVTDQTVVVPIEVYSREIRVCG